MSAHKYIAMRRENNDIVLLSSLDGNVPIRRQFARRYSHGSVTTHCQNKYPFLRTKPSSRSVWHLQSVLATSSWWQVGCRCRKEGVVEKKCDRTVYRREICVSSARKQRSTGWSECAKILGSLNRRAWSTTCIRSAELMTVSIALCVVGFDRMTPGASACDNYFHWRNYWRTLGS